MSLILLNFSFYKIFRYVFDIVILDFFCFSSLCFYITSTQSRSRRNLASTQFRFRRNLFRRNLGFDAIYSTQFARRSLGLAQLSISRKFLCFLEPILAPKWSGVVADLINEKTDVGWAHLFLTEQRNQILDVPASFDTDYYCFLVTHTKIIVLDSSI